MAPDSCGSLLMSRLTNNSLSLSVSLMQTSVGSWYKNIRMQHELDFRSVLQGKKKNSVRQWQRGDKTRDSNIRLGNVTHTDTHQHTQRKLPKLTCWALRYCSSTSCGERSGLSPTVFLLFLSTFLYLSLSFLSPVASPSLRLRSVHLSQLLPGQQVCQRRSRPGGPVPHSCRLTILTLFFPSSSSFRHSF